MKRLLLLLALVASVAQADWQQVGETPEGQIFIDPSRIYEGNVWSRAWVLVNRAKKDEYGAMSYMSFNDYDCKARDMHVVELITYSKPMGMGKTIKTARNPIRGWFAVPPNSLGEAAFDKVGASAKEQ